MKKIIIPALAAVTAAMLCYTVFAQKNHPDAQNPVTLDWQTDEKQDTAEDGTVLFTGRCNYPIVSIEGNEAAADKINADIQSRISLFQQDTSIQNFAKEDFVPENSGFIGYSSDFTFSLRRADRNVISFEAFYSAYSGGAHGNYTSIGINYNTQTGEQIDFENLGENADAFLADTFAYNRMLADTKPYQNKMYGQPSDEDLKSVLYAEDKWFFSTDGLVFISDTYALGPYAGGSINFTVPYREVQLMGLREEYRYPGPFTMHLQDGLPVLWDLNGDGTEETVLTYVVYDEIAFHLLINDTEIVTDANEELFQLLHDYSFASCTLYDLNPSDQTVEIAVITIEHGRDDDNPVIQSHLFRYEKDASVTYLGIMDGDISAPFAEPSLTAP